MIVELSRRRPRVRVPSTPPLSGAEAGAYKSLLFFVQAQSDNVNAAAGSLLDGCDSHRRRGFQPGHGVGGSLIKI